MEPECMAEALPCSSYTSNLGLLRPAKQPLDQAKANVCPKITR